MSSTQDDARRATSLSEGWSAQDQAKLNARLWVPGMLTKAERSRMVRYTSRENRAGDHWEVALPEQCWSCGRTDQLTRFKIDRTVRAFDSPLPPIVAGLGLGLLLAIVGMWWTFALVLALACVVIGVGIAWLKSAPEDVRLVVVACPDHSQNIRGPGAAIVENELHVLLPNERLAEAAQTELNARRRGKGKPPEMHAAPAAETREAPPSATETVRYAPAPRAELPPIRLDGDEEIEPI